MQASLTHLLLAAQLGFLLLLAWRCGRAGKAALYLAWLALYGIVTGIFGARGLYVEAALLEWLPGLWLQVITVTACVAPLFLFAGLRSDLRQIFDATPLHWFAWIQALRIAALGTAAKTLSGGFPVYFELLVGIPDLLFGLSALWVARQVGRGAIGERGFLLWNLVGALIIVPSAPILLQLGLPGALQLFLAEPDARAVFTYPMSLAPMIVVPLFVLINLGVAWRLWERGRPRAAAT